MPRVTPGRGVEMHAVAPHTLVTKLDWLGSAIGPEIGHQISRSTSPSRPGPEVPAWPGAEASGGDDTAQAAGAVHDSCPHGYLPRFPASCRSSRATEVDRSAYASACAWKRATGR